MTNISNNLKSKEKKERKLNFIKIPKTIKSIMVLAIVLLVLYFGINSVLKLQTKTTKLGLRDVGQLVTQTAYVTVIEDTKENRELFNLIKIPFTESRQIFSYDIEVDASVDFSKISYKPNEKKNEIVVELPHAEIYKTTLKSDSLKVYLDEESLFSRIDLTEHNEAVKAMEKQGVKDAKANGILEAADDNAKRLIESFIKGNEEYKDYKITYKYIVG